MTRKKRRIQRNRRLRQLRKRKVVMMIRVSKM